MSLTDETFSNSGDLDSLIEALRGGVTSITPEAAVSVIDSWQQTLSSATNPEAQSVVQDLGSLRDALTGGSLSSGSIGSLLTSLANGTESLAGNNPSDSDSRLSELASLLRTEGATLTDNGV